MGARLSRAHCFKIKTMGIIRSISYSFDITKPPVRRHVGSTLDVRIGGAISQLTLSEIVREDDDWFDIYGMNNNKESAKWKSVRCVNVEVEYDLSKILATE